MEELGDFGGILLPCFHMFLLFLVCVFVFCVVVCSIIGLVSSSLGISLTIVYEPQTIHILAYREI